MITIPLQPFFVWCMVFLRVIFIFSFFPLFGESFIPLRIRIVLAVVVAAALSSVAPIQPAQFPASLPGFVQLVLTEALLGFGVGLIGRILFAIIQFSGQLMGEQMGFGIINAIDPTGSRQISVISEMLYMLSILLFLASDLHHVLLATLARSYEFLPPGGAALNEGMAKFMVGLGSAMFELSLRFAMPIVVIVFVINVALGMIARGVPQINVFMESFPLRIIAGLSVLMLTLGFMASLWERMFGNMEGMMMQWVKLMTN